MILDSTKTQLLDKFFPATIEQIEESHLQKNIEIEKNVHEWEKRTAKDNTIDEIEQIIIKNNPDIGKDELETELDYWKKCQEYSDEEWDRILEEKIEDVKAKFEEEKKTPEWQAYVNSVQKVNQQQQLIQTKIEEEIMKENK